MIPESLRKLERNDIPFLTIFDQNLGCMNIQISLAKKKKKSTRISLNLVLNLCSVAAITARLLSSLSVLEKSLILVSSSKNMFGA